ncbi:hypothetical protein SY85_13085 [Flavisolibacter tropicus]|uniref:Uncharacterized protein n=2 Tax=Flavisolibacter tropicus TaxID=1492898 RepID=A0A172TX47_9BACT|nr:hypothetical protein SY85_13085 [Flavisolibacter tropicus]
MKATCIVTALLIITAITALGQNSELKKEQIQSIQKLVNSFKANNKTKIVDVIDYPLRREYPLKDVKDKNDFLQRFDDIFDRQFIDRVAESKISDWSEVGWRGIMLDNGTLWIDDNGKIMTVNYQSPKEKQLLAYAIQADKNQLPKSLQNFEKPLYLLFTKNYKIRIDEKSEGIYRYAAWKIKKQKSEPDIIIENGVLEFQGSGGNHTITFKNDGYTYTVSINELGTVDTPDATLEVSKQEKILLTEGGKIKRN